MTERAGEPRAPGRVLDPGWFAVIAATIASGLYILAAQWPHLTEPTRLVGDRLPTCHRRRRSLAGRGRPIWRLRLRLCPVRAPLVALPFRVVGEWGWFAVEVAALVWIMLESSKASAGRAVSW